MDEQAPQPGIGTGRIVKKSGDDPGFHFIASGLRSLAVASKRRVVSRKKLERQVAALDTDIARYLAELEAADATESSDAVPDGRALRETLARLQDKRADVATAAALMAEMGIDHHVQGEAEARLMKTAQGPTRVAYNDAVEK